VWFVWFVDFRACATAMPASGKPFVSFVYFVVHFFTYLRYTPVPMTFVAHHHGSHHHPTPAGSERDRLA